MTHTDSMRIVLKYLMEIAPKSASAASINKVTKINYQPTTDQAIRKLLNKFIITPIQPRSSKGIVRYRANNRLDFR